MLVCVAPKWATEISLNESEIVRLTNGKFGLLDHSIQSLTYIADSKEELWKSFPQIR